MKQRERKENGAIIVEATFCLPVFIFVILTILFVVKLAIVQERVNIASDAAAKDMAEYAHIYYATGLGDAFSGTGGTTSKFTTEVSEYMTKIGTAIKEIGHDGTEVLISSGGALSNDVITQYIEEAGGKVTETGEVITETGKVLSGDSAMDYIKHCTGTFVGKKLIKDHLITKTSGEKGYQRFKRRNGIIEEPYCTWQSNILEAGGKDIVLDVETKVRVLNFLNVNTEYTLRHVSVVHAWTDEPVGTSSGGSAALPAAETTPTPMSTPTPAPPALPAAPTVPALPAPTE